MYRIRWWLVGLFARFSTIVLFRSVEVAGSVSHDGPRLVVANHFGGLVDAIVAVRSLGGLPHIVAKSTLFDRLPLRVVLRLLGVVPVYRRVDHTDPSKNTGSFDAVAEVLAKGRTVLIFPEGTVTDDQELQEIRTGAARMALAALRVGAANLAIVPLGITYEDKVSARSRVLVEVGAPIDDTAMRDMAGTEPVEESNRQLVRELTGKIETHLRAVAPDYGSLIRERTMMLAAGIHLRTAMTNAFTDPPMSELRRVGQLLARSIGSTGHPLAATGRYQLALTASGLEDHQIQPPPTPAQLTRVVLVKGLIALLIAPLALLGLVANLIAILVVVGVGAFVKEPVTKGTARVITAVVVFPLSWFALVIVTDPVFPLLAVIVAVVGLAFLVIGIAQLAGLFEALVDWWAVRSHAGLVPDLLVLRTAADAELSAALDGADRAAHPAPPEH